MKITFRTFMALLLTVAVLLSPVTGIMADDDDEDEGSESESSQTITITNPQDGSMNQNIVQNVDVKVEVEVENEEKENRDSPSGGQTLVRKAETMIDYADICGTARTSHDWVHVYTQPTISSKILETLNDKGKPVELLAKVENSAHAIWYKVKTPSGRIGYIPEKYLFQINVTQPKVTANPCESVSPCETPSPCSQKKKCDDILPAGVTVEVTYVPEIVYVCIPQVTYVPKLIYVTPEPVSTPEPTPAPTAESSTDQP